ncbi:MAG: hypothetical protein AAF298_25900 [Cyanobacteria bacterium P01_A01_bin.40]
MKSRTTKKFRAFFARLPKQIQIQGRIAYQLFKKIQTIPVCVLKKLHSKLSIYSARISRDYRAVRQLDGDTIIWFWIGSHTDYDKLLSGI